MQKNLTVVGFKGRHRASEVLTQLENLSFDWSVDLRDAVAAYRTDDGKLRIDKSFQPTTSDGVASGAILGTMFGALLAAPFTGGLSAAAAASAVGVSALTAGTAGAAIGGIDAEDWKAEFGITDEFVKKVGGMIQPGDSAVFALIQGGNAERVAEQFRGHGGTILYTTLKPKAAERLQSVLKGEAPAKPAAAR
jgi:uncharacterized membrane protein